MARFCIVAPPQILSALQGDDLLGDYHLVLAHDVVKKPKEYEAIFSKLSPQSKFVILDNSVVELGKAVDDAMIQEAAAIVNPTCVVLPDVLRDATATIRSCEDALSRKAWQLLGGRYGLMVLPQGRKLDIFAYCAEQFAFTKEVKFWGVPRNVVEMHGTRYGAIKVLRAINKERIIHMFGFSDDLVDDLVCGNFPEVYSIDSAVPLRHTSNLSLISVPEPRGDWWETGKCTNQTRTNLKIARKWFRYK